MNEQVVEDHEHEKRAALGHKVQAGVGRAAKFADGRTRDWSLFLFFRILPQPSPAVQGDDGRTSFSNYSSMRLLNPRLFEAAEGRSGRTDAGHPAAADAQPPAGTRSRFSQLLGTATGVQEAAVANWLDELSVAVRGEGGSDRQISSGQSAGDMASHDGRIASFDTLENLEAFLGSLRDGGVNRTAIAALREQYYDYAGLRTGDGNTRQRIDALRAFLAGCLSPQGLQLLLEAPGPDSSSKGLASLAGGLPLVLLFGLARLLAPGIVRDGTIPPAIRSEADQDAGTRADIAGFKMPPGNVAFTHAGLTALGINPETLASFPAAFREGMAARAGRLGDTGASAPSNWYGELGLKSVHGLFQISFEIEGKGTPGTEELWRELRKDIAAFVERDGERGAMLHIVINALCLPLGLQVIHVELGENPYEASGDGDREYRREHFGFRDGLNQPFVDLGLGAPPPGGGTPGLSGTWAPVAPGEIFLDCEDEDHGAHVEPRNAQLREGATYFVFRKLAQDVAGFNAFLEKKRPRSEAERERLAAQMVGRWKNGTSLVHAPDIAMRIDDEQRLNDFRYAREDPLGRKCPLGAHVRRVNPRDIGGTDDVRRHRILRRSISYGGALLPRGSRGDGVERGMLFIAANSRIEQQFELIQSRWINGGEFQGQAGLGRCPLTGANGGTASDSFFEAGAVAPVSGVPQFVTTRGGDYFFVPGIATLRNIAGGHTFPPETGDVIDGGRSFGDYETLGLFHEKRIRKLVGEMLRDADTAGKVELSLPGGETFNIVRKHEDVRFLFGMDTGPAGPATVTVRHYKETGRRLTGGQDIIIGTQLNTPSRDVRLRMHGTLGAAWRALSASRPVDRIGNIARAHGDAALRRFAPTHGIDLVQDLMTPAVYGFVSEVLGVPGPNHLTEIAMALPFGKEFVGETHPDWLATLSGQEGAKKGMATLQVWSTLLLSDLIGNRYNTVLLKGLGQRAASEMLMHLDRLIFRAARNPTGTPATLLDAFVTVFPGRLPDYQDAQNPKTPDELKMAYFSDVRAILLELAGTSMATIPHSFGHVMQTILVRGIDLAETVKALREKVPSPEEFPGAVEQVILEAERLNPGAEVTLRYCAEETVLPSGDILGKDQWVALLSTAANLDRNAFPQPEAFSIPPLSAAAPDRPIGNYLMFGAGDDRICWGRNKAALVILREIFLAAARLRALRPVAGPDGEVKRLLLPVVGLKARFDGLA